jgi:MAF protein
MVEFILASQSPRRRVLVRLLGYRFSVMVADADEASITHPDPAVNVVKTAVLKAKTIAAQLQADDRIVIAADTTVALDGKMLGKPQDAEEATWMLHSLRNRVHYVHTGFVLVDLRTGTWLERVSTAVVTMRNYTDEEIAAYVASGNPFDKAGGYAIQHPVFKPAAHLQGCYTAVMGLPVCELVLALDDLHLPRRVNLAALDNAHQIAEFNFPCPVYKQHLALG